ncbi:ABC transporter permease [Nonomuraea sp. MG754425]|uniref:ABC transporter permease n=1 Tax=Nonomuraea sp. MG754425 TaxID=2570319 RepID=UPI001F20CF8C|nr:ABC transporter permease [Nonomuraea sp. MG754425]MCF6469430.1 ABC transporter permease [Nonomuraea sp. MG754425]
MSEVTVYRPGPRSWAVMLVSELKMVARDTAGLIVPLGLPMLILLVNASSAGRQPVGQGRTALDAYVLPLVFTMVVAMTGIVNMPSFLAYYRRSGILRRLGVTPASPALVLVAQAAVGILQIAVGVVAAWILAVLLFDANPPVSVGPAIGVLALTTAAMYAIGLIVAALSPTPNSAVAIGLTAFFALGASGGMFGGRDSLPDVIATIGGVLPFGAGNQALSAAWLGAPVEAGPLLGMGATIVAGVVISALFFRWE